MAIFTFADGTDICVYDGEKVKKYSSSYILNYKQNMERAARNSEWKTSGEGAVFRGDASPYKTEESGLDCRLGGIYPAANDDWVVYSFSVDRTSGIYKKCLSDDKTPETHVINSNTYRFYGGTLNVSGNSLAVAVMNNPYNSDIAVFDLTTDDYKTVTEGDTLDEDPFFSPEDANVIYYSSRGAGRDLHDGFAGFSPSAINRLNLNEMTVEEIVSSPNYNYFKPVMHGGKLYAIKAPVKEKRGNPIIEILLLPWRLLQAIANFINIFVTATTGKSLTEGGSNPARGREYDSRKIEIAGNLIDVDKQLKKNASKRDTDYGFIPKSWQLVEVESGKVIKSGVGDYDIADDGTVIFTNGKRVFLIENGKCKKIANADFCVKVGCRHSSAKNVDAIFDF